MGISIENLVMEYKKGVKSLDHINLNIDRGIFGLLGENGAGKSTLMKILVTLLTPTEGTVEINGIRLERKNYELAQHPSWVLSKEQIYEAVWKENSEHCGAAVANVVCSLRRKIGDGYIETVVGSGYRFVG